MAAYKMPDGEWVNFPDDYTKDQIKAKVLEWYPDAAETAKRSGKIGAEEAAKPTGEERQEGEGALTYEGRELGDFGYGAAQSLAGTVAGFSQLVPGQLPELTEAQRRGREQGAKDVQGFINAPSRSWAQTGGQIAGNVAPWFIPGPGLGAKIGETAAEAAARKLLTYVPGTIRGTGGRFASNPAYPAYLARITKIGEIGSTLGDVVERAAMGATIGASQDPEHPMSGAIAGAAGTGVGAAGKIFDPVAKSVAYLPGAVVGGATRLGAGAGAGWLLEQEGIDPRLAYTYGLGGALTGAGRAIQKGAGFLPRAGTKLLAKSPPMAGAITAGTTREIERRRSGGGGGDSDEEN